MKEIKLTNNKFVIVSDVDYDYLSSLGKWCADKNVNVEHFYYASKRIKGIRVRMHRLIMECIAGPIPIIYDIDHIDGNGLNNCRDNLRICLHRENIANKRKTLKRRTSKYKGVCYSKTMKRWYAEVTLNYKKVYRNHFASEKEAGMAYNEAAVKYFGEFANLNIIE